MRLQNIIIFTVFCMGMVYLLIPSPVLPTLSGSAISDEAGDTWQHPDQRGFYSNLTRLQVLSDLQSQFSIIIGGWRVPSYRLNHRVEDSQTLVRDQLNSNYLEEVVYPLRESLFINGWEPKKAPKRSSSNHREITDLYFRGIPYEAKITIRPVSSPVCARLFIWILIFPTTKLVFYSLKKSIISHE